MISKKTILIFAMFVSLIGSIAASQEYHVIDIWPEIPQGWHFFQPFGIAVDKSGNVYVGDSGNYLIKKFDSEGRLLTQWGSPGQGEGQFDTIRFIKVDRSGTVYVVDEDNHTDITTSRIQKFTPYGKFIGLFERTAPDVNKVDLTIDITEDDQGNIFVLAVDYIDSRNLVQRTAIEKYSPDGEFISQCIIDAGNEDEQLQIPQSIAIDAKGNLYINEYRNNRVKKFDPSGKFLTKWGTRGREEEQFFYPLSIAIDKSGDVLVVDRYSVQKFTPDGEFLARWDTKGDSYGIALDSHMNIYVTRLHTVLKLDNEGNMISEWGNSFSDEEGKLGLVGEGSISVTPSGDVIVADPVNNRIQRLTSQGNLVSSWGTDVWFELNAMAADASGNLYVACGSSNEIQKFDSTGKLISQWGGTGTGDGQFNNPSAVAVDLSGNVYVTDSKNNRVQKFNDKGKFLAKWGTEGTGDGQFNNPTFIAIDGSENIWIGDHNNNRELRLQKFDTNRKFLMSWTGKQMTETVYNSRVAVDLSGNAYYENEEHIERYDRNGNLIENYAQDEMSRANFDTIEGICIDKEGCLYLIDTSKVIRLDVNGNLVKTLTVEDFYKRRLLYVPTLITVDGTGNVYLAYQTSQQIYKYSSEGKLLTKFRIVSPLKRNGFSQLGGVTVDSSGSIYALDSVDVDWELGLPAVQKLDPNFQLITTLDLLEASDSKIKYPGFIAVDESGNMYVSDMSIHCVHKLDKNGTYIKSWGSKGTEDGQFNMPEGIAVDDSGNVYVCDRQNSRIQKFDSDGKFLAKWGKEGSDDGEFHFPAALAIGKDGNVFVTDSDNHRIQKFTATGKFLTKWGQYGEGPGQFNVPKGIAVDIQGNVFVGDSHNRRIQKFVPNERR
jgi:tripartite motif-containing protein 71